MQAVILAAGTGSRMQPHTLTRPKPLIEVAGKTLLAHVITSLPEDITEVIVVVGYKGDMIVEHCGDEYCGRKMNFVWQHEPLGTAHALEQAKHLLKDSFLLMYGDDIVDGAAIERALKHKSCLLVYEVEDPRAFGVIELNEDGTLKTIIEKPENPASNLVSAAGIVLHTDLFSYYGDWTPGKERPIPDVLTKYAQDHPVHVEKLSYWHPVNNIDQLKKAEGLLQ